MRNKGKRVAKPRGTGHFGPALETLESRRLLAVVSITVSGTAKWTDPAGGTHPIPLAYVQIRSTTEANDAPPLASGKTDKNGKLTDVNGNPGITLSFDTSGNARVFARIFAINPAVDVEPALGAAPDFMNTESKSPTSAVTLNFVAGNSNAFPEDQAFSILGAFLQAQTYAGLLRGGGSAPASIHVVFPAEPTAFYGPYVTVAQAEWANWDTLEHEYGHYVAYLGGFYADVPPLANGMPRPHEPLMNTPKSQGGAGLAWNEGWADFFAIFAQLDEPAPYAVVKPPPANTSYIDNSVVPPINYNLATGTGLGELDEASIASALYHCAVGDEGPTVTDTALYQDAVSAAAALGGGANMTFGAVYDAIAASMSGAQRSLLGHLLGLQMIAPVETAPDDGAATTTTGIPTFTWTDDADPAGTDDFILQFYASDYSGPVLYTTPDLGDVRSYKPDPATWANIFNGHSTVKWFVEGEDMTTPVTPGPTDDLTYPGQTLDRYWSEARSLNGPSIGIVLDVTGSMQPEINSVEAALVQYITNLQNSLSPDETPPTIDLVTFRDFPMETISSNDLDAVKAAIQAQVAQGGGDIPEPSAQSLEYAANNIGPGGTLLLITDAPSDAGSNLDGTIAALRAMGDTVNAVISGDSNYDDQPTGTGSGGSGATAAAVHFGSSRLQPAAGTFVTGSALTIATADGTAGGEELEPHQGPLTDVGQLPVNDAGNTPATASILTVDGPIVHAFIGNQVQDITGSAVTNTDDYFSFNLLAGTSYNIPVLTDGDANVNATLYGTDGVTAVASGRTIVGDPGFGYLTLTYVPKVSGTYYLDINEPTSPTGYTIQVSNDPLVGADSSVVLWTTVADATGGEFLYKPAIETNPGDPAVATDYQAAIVNVMDSTFEPTVLSANPQNVPAGTMLNVTLTGRKTNWIQGNSEVAFSAAGITVDTVTVNSPTSITATITTASSATPEFSNITVTTKLGSATETAFGSNALQISAAPTTATLLEVAPGTLARGGTYIVRVIGTLTSWDATSTLSLGPGVTISGTTVVSPTEITATAEVSANASIGFRIATVTTADKAGKDKQDMAITLTAAPVTAIATVASITPNQVEDGQHASIAVVGENTNFVAGKTTADFGRGVTVDSVKVTDATHATVTIDVGSSATIGFRNVTLTTGTETATLLDGFQVAPISMSSPVVTTNPVSQSVLANQTVSFTAAANGNPTPTVQWQLSTNNGKTFTNIAGATSTTYSFTATANQTGNEYWAVFTNSQGTATTTAATLVVKPSVVDGPQITSVKRYGIHWMPTALVLTFNQPLDPATAQDVNNYVIIDPLGHRVFINSAVYDPTTQTVSLHPARRMNFHYGYKLTVSGAQPGGVTDQQGLLLDGKNSGTPGSNYRTTVNRKNLVWPKSTPTVDQSFSTSSGQRSVALPTHSTSQGKVLVAKAGLKPDNRGSHVTILGDASARKLSTRNPAHVY